LPSVTGVWIAVGIVVIVLLLVAMSYNRLVRLRNSTDEAWAQVQVQLKRRFDLIPNLVETVKGYASHERETFLAVTNARTAAMNAKGPVETGQADSQLTGTLKSLFAVAEGYPDLKANQNFLNLQEELTSTESRIAFARQHYNNTVRDFNTRVQSFPSAVVAGILHFQTRSYFAAEGEAQGRVEISF
jgi:LemA protein